jgi:PAS domain S-box-containing protein
MTDGSSSRTGPPTIDDLRRARLRIADFGEQAAADRRPASAVLPVALVELATALEELRVCEEELYAQHDQLAVVGERMEAERHRYQTLFESAPAALVVTDPTGIVREANQAAAELFGAPVRRTIGKPLAVFVHMDDRAAFRTALRQLPDVAWVTAWRFRLQARDGATVVVRAEVNPLSESERQAEELHWVIHRAPRAPGSAPTDGDQQLGDVVDQLQHALSARIRIEQAKGVLMERNGLEETAAFELLRTTARSSSRRVVEVAEDVLQGRPAGPSST